MILSSLLKDEHVIPIQRSENPMLPDRIASAFWLCCPFCNITEVRLKITAPS